MIRLLVVFDDGTTIDETLPNHNVEEVELMVKETKQSLLVRVEIEDSRGNLTYQYKKETNYAY